VTTAAATPTPVDEMTEDQARAEFWRIMAEIDAVRERIQDEDREIAQFRAESDLLRRETRDTLTRIEEQISVLRRGR
jgi:peptidoglycan hydrolase CwlO-like protein